MHHTVLTAKNAGAVVGWLAKKTNMTGFYDITHKKLIVFHIKNHALSIPLDRKSRKFYENRKSAAAAFSGRGQSGRQRFSQVEKRFFNLFVYKVKNA